MDCGRMQSFVPGKLARAAIGSIVFSFGSLFGIAPGILPREFCRKSDDTATDDVLLQQLRYSNKPIPGFPRSRHR